MKNLNSFIREAVTLVPQVKPLLSSRARYMLYTPGQYKTYEYFLQQIERNVAALYNGFIGGEFVDLIANLISGQLLDAYQRALEDQGFTDFLLPDYLQTSYQVMVAKQYSFVDRFFRDIVDARLDGTPLAPLLQRAQLWAGQWNTAYENATRLIAERMGMKLIWREGDTLEKCRQCLALDGLVAFASEWAALGVAPKNFPNDKIDCKGAYCDCTLEPTDKRRSPNAYGRIEEILMTRKMI
jgi:hypothetical protein